MRLQRILCALSLSLLPPLSLADGEKQASPALAASPLSGGVLLETAGGLLLILVLIFALGWFFRRFGRLSMASKGDISVLSGISLGPRERAVLLQVGTTKLLVGVAPGRVQTLHVLEDAVVDETSDDQFSGQLESEIAERLK